MQFVDQAVIAPQMCAVTLDTDGPFIDTLNTLTWAMPRIYVSVKGAEELARFIGWVSPSSVEDLHEQIAALEAERDELREIVAGAEEFRRGAEYTLIQFGSKVVGKPGPKPSRAELTDRAVERQNAPA